MRLPRVFFLLGLVSNAFCIWCAPASAVDATRCHLILAYIADVYDLNDQSMLLLADYEEEHGCPITAQLLRLKSELDGLYRTEEKLTSEMISLRERRRMLLAGRELLEFALPIPSDREVSPFQSTGQHFHRINVPRGATVLLGYEPERWATFERSFEISDLITQGQWALVFGQNSSHFRRGGLLRASDRLVDPHLPVENVTFWSALVFANRVSRLEGRTEVYDLSELRFLNVRRGDFAKIERLAGLGELKSYGGRLIIRRNENGYRLPTDDEWEYVARGGILHPNFRSVFPFGDEPALLLKYGYFNQNSKRHTERVATLKPNPLGVHDMHGNVWEWVQDKYLRNPPGGNSSLEAVVEDSVASDRTMRGGSWLSRWQDTRSCTRRFIAPGVRVSVLGFRLVRNLGEP